MLVDAGSRPLAQTDAEGRYRIGGVAPGSHIIVVRASGFAPSTKTIDVGRDAVQADFTVSPTAATLSAVTVIGTRSDLAETRERMFQVAGAVALIDPAEIRQTRQANLKDVLKFTPGVYVQPRFGAADESQISVRGSGLRNNFHARGINLLVNGMPYRNADGFTDFESLELLTTEAIRGLQGRERAALRRIDAGRRDQPRYENRLQRRRRSSAFAEGGGFGFYKEQLSSGGACRPIRLLRELRAHRTRRISQLVRSEARSRESARRVSSSLSSTDVRAFYFFAHVQEHLPGSLDRATLEAKPTRGRSDQREQSVGSRLRPAPRRRAASHPAHADAAVRGQSVPAVPRHRSPDLPGDHQLSHDVGVEVRYENTTPVGSRENRLTLGFQPAQESMHNRQYQNVKGDARQPDAATNRTRRRIWPSTSRMRCR